MILRSNNLPRSFVVSACMMLWWVGNPWQRQARTTSAWILRSSIRPSNRRHRTTMMVAVLAPPYVAAGGTRTGTAHSRQRVLSSLATQTTAFDKRPPRISHSPHFFLLYGEMRDNFSSSESTDSTGTTRSTARRVSNNNNNNKASEEEDDELDALDRILDQNIVARASAANRTATNSTDTGADPPKTTTTAADILAIDPEDIIMVEEEQQVVTTTSSSTSPNDPETNSNNNLNSMRGGLPDFVPLFRGSANYIANHRNTVAVYHIPGSLLRTNSDEENHDDEGGDGGVAMGINGDSTASFSASNNTSTTTTTSTSSSLRDLMNDIALTWLLGMQIVLVAGCRTQVQERLAALSHNNNNNNHTDVSSSSLSSPLDQPPGGTTTPWLRVTDANELRIVKEEAGYVRFELERELARALRLQSGGGTGMAYSSSRGGSGNNGNGPQSPSFYEGNVVSGNFYSAQPLGVQDGVDYKYTGFVRRIEVEKIRQVHAQRDICLLSALGVSPSGEVFNVNAEALAATTAGALGAKKVIYFTEAEMCLRHRVHQNKIQCLRLSEARNLLKHHEVQMNKKGFAVTSKPHHYERRTVAEWDMLLKIGWCCEAIALGVKRAHIISPQHGALLQELYTRDGSGTLISADLYEGIRQASVLDVSKIHALIKPLIEAGTLIDRPKAVLEKDIEQYYVYTRDNTIVACGQLKEFENGFAEIGCLVVNKDFRSAGRGDAMLGYLERLCLRRNCNKVFVLSTQTMEWFVERGFDEADVVDLPPSRQQTYNLKRKSKIYLKEIESDRDLDASELFWT